MPHPKHIHTYPAPLGKGKSSTQIFSFLRGGMLFFRKRKPRNQISRPTSHNLAGGFKPFFIFTPKLGEMIQFDEHIFQIGWFNHQLAPSLKLTQPLKIGNPKRKLVFKPSIFRGYVSFRECNSFIYLEANVRMVSIHGIPLKHQKKKKVHGEN